SHSQLRHFCFQPDHDHEKLVAAPAIDQVFGTNDLADRANDRTDREIARGMPETVIYALEIVYIEKADTAVNAGSGFGMAVDESIKGMAIECRGKRVGTNEFFQLVLCFRKLGVGVRVIPQHGFKQKDHHSKAKCGL